MSLDSKSMVLNISMTTPDFQHAHFHVSAVLNGKIRVRSVEVDFFTLADLDAAAVVFEHSSAPSNQGAGFVFIFSFQDMTARPETYAIKVSPRGA